MVAKLVRDIPGAVISVHCHNDLGLAVANSLAAVQAGARQVECTINGIGERAGNTALEEIAMALKVRGESLGVETGIKAELLAPTSAMLSGITGVWPQPNKAIVGRNAFAHEAGIHQHGILANPLCYEIMTPASVGVRETSLVLGKHSGKHAVESRLLALGLAPKADELEEITTQVKALADQKKFVYDDDLLTLVQHAPERRTRLIRYQVLAGNQVLPTATVEVEVDGQRRTASAVGQRSARRGLEGRRRRPRPGAGAPRDADPRPHRGQGRAGRGDRPGAPRGRRVLGPGGERRHHRGHAQGLPVGRGGGPGRAGRGLGGRRRP